MTKKKLIHTSVFTLAFPNLFSPRKIIEFTRPKYNMVALFNKETADVAGLQAAIEEVGRTRFESEWFRSPLKNGEKKTEFWDTSAFYVLNATSFYRPLIKEELAAHETYLGNEEDFYPGCLCVAELSLFAYNAHGYKGVGAQMHSVTKIGDMQVSADEAAMLASDEAFIDRTVDG